MPKSKETRLLKYLTRLISYYNLDSDVFINCLYDAHKRGESKFDGLTVTCRGESDGQLIFLLTIKWDVVG